MKKNLGFSIIIPVFNGERYLKENINSLKNQSYSTFEVIYIDDGSKDRSLEVLKQECARDPRFKWFSKPNGGIASAIKFGLERASSDYIVLLDQDDVAMSNRIEITMRAFLEGAELIMGDYEIVDENLHSTDKVITLPDYINSENILLEQLKRSYILGSALAFKNKHDFSFLESSGGATDYDISLKMLLNGYRFNYIPEVVIKYRVHQNNTSANYRNQKRDISNVIDQYTPEQLASSFKDKGFNESEIYLSLGILYLFLEKLEIANRLLAKAEGLLDQGDSRLQEELYFYIGVLKYRQGDFSTSLLIYEQLFQKFNNTSILNNLGIFMVYKKDWNQATELFRNCLETNPDYMDAQHNLNECQKKSISIEQYRFTTRLLRKKLTHKVILS